MTNEERQVKKREQHFEDRRLRNYLKGHRAFHFGFDTDKTTGRRFSVKHSTAIK